MLSAALENWSMKESSRNKLLSCIFKSWRIHGVRYLCLGDVLYNDKAQTGDIDILLSHSYFDLAIGLAIEHVKLFSTLGIHLIKSPSPFGQRTTKLLVCLDDSALPILQLDIASSMHWRGWVYLRYEDLMDKICVVNDIPEIPLTMAATIGALKDVFYKGKISSKRFDNGFPNDDSWKLMRCAGFREEELISFSRQPGRSIDGVWKRICLLLKVKKVEAISGFVGYILSFLISILPSRKKLCVLAFYGPDGAGKSTVIELLCQSEFIREAYRTVQGKHTRPHVLPPFSWYLNPFKSESERLAGRPARSVEPVSQFKAIVFALYYALDFFIGRIINLRFLFSRKSHLLIYDRFVLEFAYQPVFKSMPKIARSWLSWAAGRPTMTAFIYADPVVIRSRKPELEEEEVARQIADFKKIDAEMRLNAQFVDSSMLVPSAVCNELLARLEICKR
jgi:thymidylate kinase